MTNNLGPTIGTDTLRDYVESCANSCIDQPVYLYDLGVARARVALLKNLFGKNFGISYAIKSNPNQALLNGLADVIDYFDASSFAETRKAGATGKNPTLLSYSGPGKRLRELRAFIGTGAELVIESNDEIADADAIAAEMGVIQKIMIRINPDFVPRGFGASMSGKPSQFGIEEGLTQDAIDQIDACANLTLVGLHIYTGSNCLSPQTLIENFANMSHLFLQFSQNGTRVFEKLIFGAGFGLPYHPGQAPLAMEELRQPLHDIAVQLRSHDGLIDTAFVLELGRWIVGPAGALMTTVLSVKESRGQTIAICDAGFNNHLAACGMMGSVFRKDWPIGHVMDVADRDAATLKLTGPLCTSIDSLAGPLEMPEVRRDDILAVTLSGAYGLTASPTRFISHPDPLEIVFSEGDFVDASESNHNRFDG